MQGTTSQRFEFGETIQKVTVSVTRITGDVVKFLNITRTYTEGKYHDSGILQKISDRTWITAVAESVGYEKYYLPRRFPAFLEYSL